MSIGYESAHKRFRDARDEYNRAESMLAAARAKLNAAERECSVEWRNLLDATESERARVTSHQNNTGDFSSPQATETPHD